MAPFFDRSFDAGPQVIIRHAYPPNWDPPKAGKWVHIQPWEFGHLPIAWVEPLRNNVDEAWVYSRYVRRVYVDSGIPSHKIQVIPLGIDPAVFNPEAEPLILPTTKSFAFLFVGGVIERKGADIALEAFLQEFGPADDVCLVVKDVGSQTFYRDSPCRDRLLEALDDSSNPTIVYLNQTLTDGQLASLYTACQCLVAPYRGEGFGLPILEGMACGLPPIVPRGGPTDDFVTKKTGIFLPSATVECAAMSGLSGPATELQLSVSDVRQAMRFAFENRSQLYQMGRAGSRRVRRNFTWSHTVDRMTERLQAMAPPSQLFTPSRNWQFEPTAHPQAIDTPSLCGFVIMRDNEARLGNCFARLAPFVEELIAIDTEEKSKSAAIAQEYGARVYSAKDRTATACVCNSALHSIVSDWLMIVGPAESLSEEDIAAIRACIAETPPTVLAISLQLVSDRIGASGDITKSELRVFRRERDLAFDARFCDGLLPKLHRDQFQIVNLPVALRRS